MGSTFSSIVPLYNPTRSKRARTLPVKRRRSSSSSVKTLYEAENLVDEKSGISNQPQEALTLAYSPSYAISTGCTGVQRIPDGLSWYFNLILSHSMVVDSLLEYQLTWILDTLRRTDYTRLDRTGETYVDYMGGALYPESLISVHTKFLCTNILGNTHSVSNRCIYALPYRIQANFFCYTKLETVFRVCKRGSCSTSILPQSFR